MPLLALYCNRWEHKELIKQTAPTRAKQNRPQAYEANTLYMIHIDIHNGLFISIFYKKKFLKNLSNKFVYVYKTTLETKLN